MHTALRCTVSLSALFVVVYGSCNWLTARRHDTFKLYFDWELTLPFIPWMVWIYVSLFILFALPVFGLDRAALVLLSRRIALGIAIAGVVFLLLPAQLGFVRAAEPGGLFAVIHALDHPHNLVPSLHVIISGLIIHTLCGVSPPWLRLAFAVWFTLICVSVVLVHQHHLLDVASAVLVTCWLTRIWRNMGGT